MSGRTHHAMTHGKLMRPIQITRLTAFFVLVWACSSFAQFTKEYDPWPVVKSGDTIKLPFLGGMNSPKPSLVDFDHDGLPDLFLGETLGKVIYFHNTGTSAQPVWTPVTERMGGVNTRSWHRFADIDADGDWDLFCDAGNSMTAYYRNESVGSNIQFTLIKDDFGLLETGVNNTGSFTDLDHDGDLDFFLGSPTGDLWFYRNDGDSTSPLYTLASTFYDSVFAFPGAMASSVENPQHGFSTINFADYDGDNDADLFWGDINNNSAYLFKNLGTPSVSRLKKETETYLPISTLGLNHTAFADLDGDGDLDMLVGAANGDDIDNLYFLRNVGSTTVPNYVPEDSNVIKDIDVGSYAIPALGDLDHDGDLDLLIGRSDGRLTYFENVGTKTSPSFLWVSDYYKTIDVGLSSAPALVDWDKDGDFDLLIGNEDGKVQYWRNDGSVSNFNPVLVTNQLGGIQVDILATPCPVDLNDDGLTDLVVGEWDFNGSANLLLYQNLGPANNPTLAPVTNRLIRRQSRDMTIPSAYDWDCDGRKDLIVGGRLLGFTYYRNTTAAGSFPDSLSLVAQPDVLPGADDGYRMSMALADIDGDLDRDVFVGEEDGGINFYRNDGSSCHCPLHGDPDGDGSPTVLDVVMTINVAFRGNADLSDASCCPYTSRVDHNCDCQVDILDVVWIIGTAFRGGPPSCNACLPGNHCPR